MLAGNRGLGVLLTLFFLQITEGKFEIPSFIKWMFYSGKTESMKVCELKTLVRSCLRTDSSSTGCFHLLLISAD